MRYRTTSSGFSLVEAVVVAALSALVFGSLFASFQFSLKLINNSRAKLAAVSLANERLEYFRSLPYDSVGTVAGIPSGVIPQNSTSSLNGITFFERVLVEYVDDDADGENVSDSNSIPSDYKRVKVEYSWNLYGATSTIAMISNIVPRSIETTAGGGTVRVNVLDADATLLPGASVRLVNNTLVPNIDVTRITDSSGTALFSGAPAGSDYELYVTATISGDIYSTAQTYQVSAANPTPILAPFAVLEADISTLTLQIGALSDLTVLTRSSITEGAVIAGFSDLSEVSSSTDVIATGGELTLAESGGIYTTSGVTYLEVTPTAVAAWGVLRLAADLPLDTAYTIRFYTGASTSAYTLIPDAELPGNSTGFSQSLVDVSALDPIAYPSIVAGIALTTSDTSVSPQIDEIGVYYRESETALGSLAVDYRGDKFIGTLGDGSRIYKVSDSFTTDGSGEAELTDLEFDTYTFTFPSAYAIAEACPAHPFVQQAGVDGTVEFLLVSDPTYSYRVSIVNGLGEAIPGASVDLSRAGYSDSQVTSVCGQVFFTGMSAADDFALQVSAAGYNTENFTNISIDGNDVVTITLTE